MFIFVLFPEFVQHSSLKNMHGAHEDVLVFAYLALETDKKVIARENLLSFYC